MAKHCSVVFLLILACSSLLDAVVVRAQDCGPPGGGRCSGSGCCSQFGYCGNSCDYCGAGCQSGYGSCGGCSCFPGTAVVITPFGTKLISELRVGEEVGVHDGRGGVAFEAVYAHAHSDANAESEFVVLTLRNLADNSTRTLELTPRHFTMVQDESHKLHYKRAQDVRIGDSMLVVAIHGHQQLSPFIVSDIRAEFMTGLYKPLTLGGNIVVNHVLASCHSEWLLGSLLKQAWGTHALPSVYQAMLAPLRFIYNAMPAHAYTWMYKQVQSLPKLVSTQALSTRFPDQLISPTTAIKLM